MRSLLVVLALLAAALALASLLYALALLPRPADAALVFGETDDPRLRTPQAVAERLEVARSLHARGLVRWIVVSGRGGTERFDDARVMHRWLAAHGVPDSAVVEDPHGAGILRGSVHAEMLLAPRGGRTFDVVIPRAELLLTWGMARRAGIRIAGFAAPRSFTARDLGTLWHQVGMFPLLPIGMAPPRKVLEDPEVRAQADLDAATRAYADRILRMDAAGIAASFTEDGETQDGDRAPIRGPAAIRAFLEEFKNFRVLTNALVADSTSIEGGRAHQDGTFLQTVRLPDGQVVTARGRFAADWRRVGPEWKLERMHTQAVVNPGHGGG